MLTLSDFTTHRLSPDLFYLEHKDAYDRSVCIEPCLSGFDVALYYQGDIVGNKRCTNINVVDEATQNKAIVTALNIANAMWNKWQGMEATVQ